MSPRKICVVTTSRADFGLLTPLLKVMRLDPGLSVQLIASGMHLSPEFGSTCAEIEAEGIPIARRIYMLVAGDCAEANVNSLGVGLVGFAGALTEMKPDVLILLGDRFELLAVATAALLLRIPIAHLHGGERSEGAIDEAVRHAVTKMAYLHFPAAEEYRRRIIQMGEEPERVFNFGSPGLDRLYAGPLPARALLEQQVGFAFSEPVALITYHPTTLDPASGDVQIHCLMEAVIASGLKAICTAANADAEGVRINQYLRECCDAHPNRFKWIPHLGRNNYLGCLRECALMVGNSSSGITEAPSFALPVVNVGPRQQGRVRAANIIDVVCNRDAIVQAIRQATSSGFGSSLKGMNNPYDRFGDGTASIQIKEVIKHADLSAARLLKRFHDWPVQGRYETN